MSAPAVNKWERSIHYPDITLLPSLARVLGVDLNTLLSFQEDMTEEDIGLFLNRIYETAGAEGGGGGLRPGPEQATGVSQQRPAGLPRRRDADGRAGATARGRQP